MEAILYIFFFIFNAALPRYTTTWVRAIFFLLQTAWNGVQSTHPEIQIKSNEHLSRHKNDDGLAERPQT